MQVPGSGLRKEVRSIELPGNREQPSAEKPLEEMAEQSSVPLVADFPEGGHRSVAADRDSRRGARRSAGSPRRSSSLVATPPTWAEVAGVTGLLAAATAAEAFPLPIEGVNVGAGTTSLAIVSIVATAVIYGWEAAGIVGFLTMAIVEAGRRRPPTRVVFNTGVYVCSAILAGLAAAPFGSDNLGEIIAASCLGAAAFYAVDMLFLSAVIARTRRLSWHELLLRYLYSTTLPFLVMTSLIITLVVLWNRSPWISIIVVGPLITVALHERWLHGALEQLREFDRLKDEFIAVISHELRTPLTSVYGAALTLQKREVDDEMRDALLDIVSDEAGRLARLLDRALSASRLDANREIFEIQSLDGGEIASSIVDAARHRLPPGLELELARRSRRPGGPRRPGQAPPDPRQPDGERDQVLARRRPRRGARRGRRPARPLQREGRGHRHRAGAAAAHLRALPPARPEHDARRRRPRARPLHLARAREAHGRHHLGHVARGSRLDVHVRAAGRRRRCLGKNTQAGDGSVP